MASLKATRTKVSGGKSSLSPTSKRSASAAASIAAAAENRRGSPEAIEKRRVARVFNDILSGGTSSNKLDGRTEKRRQRLLKELEAGKARGSRELKPLDILQRVQELMDLGEPLSSIRKVTKVKKTTVAPDAIVDVVERLHKAYSFRPEVYRFVGIGEEVLREAGVLADGAKRKRASASIES